MTTLEVVEAVQRSLENEGFLQSIRAQLRSNVLRIISSGPDYVPSQGKVVEFSGRSSGALSLQLVRDLLASLGLKESLSVFEAESGIEKHSTIDQDSLLAELHIQRIQDFCFLECLVLNATTYDRTQDYHGTQPNSDSKGGKESAHVFKEKKANESNASVNRSLGQSTSFAEEDAEEVGSVEEEIDDHDSDAPEDFSQLEDGAKSPQAPPRVETENKHSPVDSPVRPSYGLTNSGRLDESSSFEADSPAKVQMQADFKQTAVLTNRDHKVATTADVDDSFAEDSVHDSVQEEMDESSQQGPEYDSDSHSSHHSDHKQDRKGASSPLPPVAVATKNLNATADAKQLAQSPDASKDEQDVPATEDASSPEVEVEVALARATAEDFDRVDRSGVDQDMATRRSNVRNRVAVQRAGQPAEGKSADGDAAGAKASVFRLGQSSISRSTLGWGNTANNMDTSASFEEDVRSDEDEGKGYAPTRTSGGRTGTASASAGARYSSTSQMEAVSFESTDNERSPSKPAVAATQPQRRSNNQEESEGEGSAGEQDFSDFEADEQDEQSSNQQSPPRKGVAARGAAFASPTKSERSEQDPQDASAAEEDEEYADEGFDEDFEDEDDQPQGKQHSDREKDDSPARPAPGPARAFAAAAAGSGTSSGYNPTLRGAQSQQMGGKSNNQQADDSEAEEVESIVEEDIPEEDEFSVGDQDSEEDGSDGGFNDAARKKPAASVFTPSTGTGLSRAGRSGALPGIGVKAPGAAARGSNFDALLNNSDTSEEERPLPSRASAGSRSDKSQTGITARMQEIDNQLEEMERDDSAGNLARVRKAHEQQQSAHRDDSSVASEDIDAMEFSTGGGGDEDSESSGEGSFSFLDSSSKK